MSKMAEKTVLVNSALDNLRSACEDLVISKAKLLAMGGEELFTHIEVWLHDEDALNRASKALQDAIEQTLGGAEQTHGLDPSRLSALNRSAIIMPGEIYALHSSIADPEVVAPKEKKSRKKAETPAQDAPTEATVPIAQAPVVEAPVVAPATELEKVREEMQRLDEKPVAPSKPNMYDVMDLANDDMEALKARANELLKQYAKKTTVVTAQTLINDVGGSGRLSLFDRATLLKLIDTVTALVK